MTEDRLASSSPLVVWAALSSMLTATGLVALKIISSSPALPDSLGVPVWVVLPYVGAYSVSARWLRRYWDPGRTLRAGAFAAGSAWVALVVTGNLTVFLDDATLHIISIALGSFVAFTWVTLQWASGFLQRRLDTAGLAAIAGTIAAIALAWWFLVSAPAEFGPEGAFTPGLTFMLNLALAVVPSMLFVAIGAHEPVPAEGS